MTAGLLAPRHCTMGEWPALRTRATSIREDIEAIRRGLNLLVRDGSARMRDRPSRTAWSSSRHEHRKYPLKELPPD